MGAGVPADLLEVDPSSEAGELGEFPDDDSVEYDFVRDTGLLITSPLAPGPFAVGLAAGLPCMKLPPDLSVLLSALGFRLMLCQIEGMVAILGDAECWVDAGLDAAVAQDKQCCIWRSHAVVAFHTRVDGDEDGCEEINGSELVSMNEEEGAIEVKHAMWRERQQLGTEAVAGGVVQWTFACLSQGRRKCSALSLRAATKRVVPIAG